MDADKIAVFAIDEKSGAPRATEHALKTRQPVCIRF